MKRKSENKIAGDLISDEKRACDESRATKKSAFSTLMQGARRDDGTSKSSDEKWRNCENDKTKVNKPKTKESAFSALMEGSKRSNGGTKTLKEMSTEDAIKEGNEKIECVLRSMNSKNVEDFLVCVISKGRPSNVASIHSLFQGTCKKHLPTWIVGKGETKDYEANGAVEVVEGGGLCQSRNLAIELAKKANKICVEISDDITRCAVLHSEQPWIKPAGLSEGNAIAKLIPTLLCSPTMVARYVEATMRQNGTRLGGAYPTKNEGQAMGMPPVTKDLFIVGDFLVIDPNSKPRFDEGMSLKEDYDFTAQHLKMYGRVTRSNRVFISAKHYTNSGGAVAVRNDEKEQYNIAVLRHKWPGVFPQHATRGPNEVRMAWKSRGLGLGGRKAVHRPKAPEGYNPTAGCLTGSSSTKNNTRGTVLSFFRPKQK
eukprot:g2639.t1